MFFRRKLQIKVDGGDEILSGDWFDKFDGVSETPETIDDNRATAVAPAEKMIVSGFEPFFSNYVTRFETVVLLFGQLELARADLADVTQNMGQQTVLRVVSLRTLFDMKQRKLQ